jgi:hypothetical protein
VQASAEGARIELQALLQRLASCLLAMAGMQQEQQRAGGGAGGSSSSSSSGGAGTGVPGGVEVGALIERVAAEHAGQQGGGGRGSSEQQGGRLQQGPVPAAGALEGTRLDAAAGGTGTGEGGGQGVAPQRVFVALLSLAHQANTAAAEAESAGAAAPAAAGGAGGGSLLAGRRLRLEVDQADGGRLKAVVC